MRKCTDAVVGARIESVNKIGAIECVEIHLDVMQVRFMARAIGDSEGVGDLIPGAENGTSRSVEVNMIVKALTGVGGARVQWWGQC